MTKINTHYQKLKSGYLFPEIARRVNEFQSQNPNTNIIRLGIGDVTQPLPKAVIEAGKKAFDEMGEQTQFKGYGPEQGYAFLREAISENDYQSRNINISPNEIFISDGSKCDTGNIQEIFGLDVTIGISDPVYPVYVDTNVMAGRSGEVNEKGRFANIVYLEAKQGNHFLPSVPKEPVDLVYLCFPNNPTGVVATKIELKKWVDWANKNKAIILFDAAYEAFITDDDIPHSIYEIKGAKTCAIEFRSFSKTAGFTGTRCAFTVVPKELMGEDDNAQTVSIHSLWSRRQATKFNGVSYPIQKAALACYSKEGKEQIKRIISYYHENARIILEGLQQAGYTVFGGVHSPYIWFKTPNNMSSWDFFDLLLQKAGVVGTPGSGFGPCGEGYFRLSAFGEKENVKEAISRMSQADLR